MIKQKLKHDSKSKILENEMPLSKQYFGIICLECNKPITSRKELVTMAHFGILVRPYHISCFSKPVQSKSYMFMTPSPVNGLSGTLITIFLPLLGIWILYVFSLFKSWFSNIISYWITIVIICLILILNPVYLRLYSYFVFERQLNKN